MVRDIRIGAKVYIDNDSEEKAVAQRVTGVLSKIAPSEDYPYITKSGESWVYAVPVDPEDYLDEASEEEEEGYDPIYTQVGGSHYKSLKIQPAVYCHANNIPFIEGCIIKYATRWRDKGGIEDLKKIKHFASILIALEEQTDGN